MSTGRPGRPRLSERHRAQRAELIRKEIVDAALTEFTERGYHDTSIGHIGERLGSAPSMIYNYFTNKREILEFAVDETLATVGEMAAKLTAAQALTADEFRDSADRISDTAVEIFTRDPRIPRMLLVIATSNDPELRARWTSTVGVITALFEQFLTDGVEQGRLRPGLDCARAARVILGVPFGMILSDPQQLDDPEEARALARATVAVVTQGIYPNQPD